MEMEPPRPVVMMGAEVHVEPAPLAKNAAGDLVFVPQIVQVAIAGMMGVEVTLVEFVHHLRHVRMVFVWELPQQIVPEESVDPTEQEEVVEVAQTAKGADLANVSVIMIAMNGTVGMQSNLKGPILGSALKDPVEAVLTDSLADQREDVPLSHLALSPLLLSTVVPEEPFPPAVQC